MLTTLESYMLTINEEDVVNFGALFLSSALFFDENEQNEKWEISIPTTSELLIIRLGCLTRLKF